MADTSRRSRATSSRACFLGLVIACHPASGSAQSTSPSPSAHGVRTAPGGLQPGGGQGNGPQPNVGTAFGFTGSSDVAPAGGWLLESENTGRIGRRDGQFEAYRSDNKLGYGVTDTVSVGLKTNFGRWMISGAGSSPDREATVVQGLSGLVKYRPLQRGRDALGLSVEVGPEWGRYNGGTAAPEDSVSANVRISADVRVGASDFYLGSNLAFVNAWAWPAGRGVQRSSSLEVTAAGGYVKPTWSVGGEVRLLAAYGDLMFGRLAGSAFHVGPAASLAMSRSVYLAAAWSIQVSGDDRRAGTGLNLDVFERHQVRIKVGYTF